MLLGVTLFDDPHHIFINQARIHDSGTDHLRVYGLYGLGTIAKAYLVGEVRGSPSRTCDTDIKGAAPCYHFHFHRLPYGINYYFSGR